MRLKDYKDKVNNFQAILEQMKTQKKRLDDKQVGLQNELEKELGYGFNTNLELSKKITMFLEWNVNCRVFDLDIFKAYENFFADLEESLRYIEEYLQEAEDQIKDATVIKTGFDKVKQSRDTLIATNKELVESHKKMVEALKALSVQSNTKSETVSVQSDTKLETVSVELDTKPETVSVETDTKPEEEEEIPSYNELAKTQKSTIPTYNDLKKMKRDKKKANSCAAKGCIKKPKKEGMCVKHWMQKYEGGEE